MAPTSNSPGKTKEAFHDRRHFLGGLGTFFGISLLPSIASAESYQSGIVFEGGAGGLSKKQADTGVRRMGYDLGGDGSFLDEVQLRDGTRVLVSFTYPSSWRSSNKETAIDVRDLQTSDSAFVTVKTLPEKYAEMAVGDLPARIVTDTLFSKDGKFGSYGVPEDVKVKSDTKGNLKNRRSFEISFTAYTPAMRTVLKESFVTAIKVESTLLLLTSTTNKSRYKIMKGSLKDISDSFQAAKAPKTFGEQRKALKQNTRTFREYDEDEDWIGYYR